jgi:hypothetical protein
VNLPADVNRWPEFWQEQLAERTAIMQFDAGMTAARAEVCARRATEKLAEGAGLFDAFADATGDGTAASTRRPTAT